MRMALVGSPAFPTDDQEDNDFFEQLANDLGDDGHVSELQKPVGIYRNYELEEVNCNEGFSKLTISGAGSGQLSSTITEENEKIDSAGDDSWLEDALNESSSATLQEGIADNRPRPKETLGETGSTDVAKTLSGTLDDSREEVNNSICAQEKIFIAENEDGEHGLMPSDVDNSSSLVTPPQVSPEADFGNPQDEAGRQDLTSKIAVGERGFVSDIHDLDAADDVRQNGAAEALTSSSIRSEALSLDPQNVVAADRVKMTEDLGSTNVKELQWSSFGEVFTHEGEQGAFGSYSDFLTDVDAGTTSIYDSGFGAHRRNQEDWSFSAPMAASTSQSEWGFETETHTNFGFGSDAGVFEGLSNEPGVHDHEIRLKADGQAILSHNNVAEISEQVLGHSGAGSEDFGSEARGQPQGDFAISNSSYEAQGQGDLQQSWENMYPGWFYDYASNEWKPIEGYDFGTGSAPVVEQVSVTKDGSMDFPLGTHEATSSQMEATSQGEQFSHNAADFPYQATDQEHVAVSSGEALGLMKETGVYAASTDVYGMQNAHYDAVSQPQVYWEEQYPGWYYDYHAQEWRQTADNSQAWQFNAPSQENKIVDSQVADSSDMNYGNSSSPMPMEQGQPEYQHKQNQNTYWPESSQSLYTSGGGDVAALSQSVSFNSWTRSDLAFNANDQSNITTDNMRETFQGNNAALDSWNGWQGYNNGVFRYSEQSQTDYVQADNSTYFGAQSSYQFPPVQQYPVAHLPPRTVTEALRSSAGRPPHALAAFVFGGKFAVTKATSGGQFGTPGPIILHDLKQLVESADSSSQMNVSSYFSSFNRPGLTGPLVGGGFTNKELFRWIDERADNCELEDPYCSSAQVLHLLWSVLKIACMHYGKLRSMVGSAGIKSQAEDGPEVALGRLFAAAKSNRPWSQDFSASPGTLQSVPTEQQLQATAVEMKKNLVAGKRKEALQLAQQGQLWGPALVLAWQLGEKFYGDTVSQMAQQQFVPGSPLRTLFLLFAGQPTELFTTQNVPSSAAAQVPYSFGPYNSPKQDSAGGMLGDWLENLSIIAANRTKGDEQIIMHLGDCLWKERGEVAGAHTCYIVAEANFESFSKNARLCLVGADHFKHQRTFATPQAIQRTELYEYAKVLGNSQYILVPFQPYKLLYAHMLAEAGKVAEARRYCQAVTKTLKNAGRAPEIESCRQSAVALDERLRLHSQGGYSLNSATGKLVGKFIGTIDSTIHRIIGGPPPPQASESLKPSHAIGNGRDWHASDQRTGNAAPRMNFTPLVPSASNSSLFNANNQVEVPPRSISEPDFSRSPTQENSNPATSADASSAAPNHRKTESSGAGYLGRFGTQIFAKAVGFIKPNKKEAKLGDKNKFYYDDKLKRWVEEGVEQSSEEIALPPPPISTSFGSGFGTRTLETKTGAGIEGQGQVSSTFGSGSFSSDTPPMPPSVNQFSARGRLHGVRSRYVDTFNKGGNTPSPAMSTQSPIVPNAGRASTSTPVQLFVPASISASANEFSGMPDNGLVNVDKPELPSGATIHSILNGHLQTEHEPLEPKNLSSSFMAVPSIPRHSSASNVSMYAREEFTAAAGVGGGLSDIGTSAAGNISRAVSWSGDSSHLAPADVPKFIPTLSGTPAMQSFGMPNGGNLKINHTLPAVKAETSRIYAAGGILDSTLPSPPMIENPPSYIGVDNSLLSGAIEGRIAPGAPTSGQVGIYGDMQEVEL